MIWAVLAAIAGWAGTAAAFTRVLASQQRSHARERDLLVNQLLHATGNAWQPAPADTQPARPARVVEVRGWTPSPEQQPIPS